MIEARMVTDRGLCLYEAFTICYKLKSLLVCRSCMVQHVWSSAWTMHQIRLTPWIPEAAVYKYLNTFN
jgi:hypothetical protein